MVSAVDSVNNYSANVQNPKKKNYIKKGAAVGAGLGLAYSGLGQIRQRALLEDMIITGQELGCRNKMLAAVAAGIALSAAVCAGVGSVLGAGVGAIVKAVKGDSKAKEA